MSLLILFTRNRPYVTVSDPGTGGAGGGSYVGGHKESYLRQPEPVLYEDLPKKIKKPEVNADVIESAPPVEEVKTEPVDVVPEVKATLKAIPTIEEVVSWNVEVPSVPPEAFSEVSTEEVPEPIVQSLLSVATDVQPTRVEAPLDILSDEEILILFFMAKNK